MSKIKSFIHFIKLVFKYNKLNRELKKLQKIADKKAKLAEEAMRKI